MVNVQETGVRLPGTAQRIVSTTFNISGFSLGHLHMRGFVPPPYEGGQVQGDKALMGGLMRGDMDFMVGT